MLLWFQMFVLECDKLIVNVVPCKRTAELLKSYALCLLAKDYSYSLDVLGRARCPAGWWYCTPGTPYLGVMLPAGPRRDWH